MHHTMADRPEEHPREAAVAARAHDDEAGPDVDRVGSDRRAGSAAEDVRVHIETGVCAPCLVGDVSQRLPT